MGVCVLVQTATPKWLVVTTLGGHTLGRYSARMHNIDTGSDTSYMFVYDCDVRARLTLHLLTVQPASVRSIVCFFFFFLHMICKRSDTQNDVSSRTLDCLQKKSDLLQLVLMFGHLYWWMRLIEGLR